MIQLKIIYNLGTPQITELPAESIEEASRITRAFIEEYDLGSSAFAGANLYDNEQYVGQIAYNGRFFDKNNEYGKEFVQNFDLVERLPVHILIHHVGDAVAYAIPFTDVKDAAKVLNDSYKQYFAGLAKDIIRKAFCSGYRAQINFGNMCVQWEIISSGLQTQWDIKHRIRYEQMICKAVSRCSHGGFYIYKAPGIKCPVSDFAVTANYSFDIGYFWFSVDDPPAGTDTPVSIETYRWCAAKGMKKAENLVEAGRLLAKIDHNADFK